MKILSDEPSNLTPGMRIWTVQPEATPHPFLVTVNVPMAEAPEGGFNGAISTDGNSSGGTVNQAFMYPAMSMEIPATVTVSIGYPIDNDPSYFLARNTDLTPSHWPEWDESYNGLLGGEDGKAPTSGQADAFLKFICDELKPTLEANFPINSNQWSLAGHSLGGLFATHCALSRPAEFRRYLAVGSSYWWRNREIFKRAKAFNGTEDGTKRAIYIAAGTLESRASMEADWSKYMDQAKWQEYIKIMNGFPDIWGDSQEMASILDKAPGFSANFDSITGETHGTAVLTALSRGITWLHQATEEKTT
jgi:predicted alpha/beta superfamily hydrolase